MTVRTDPHCPSNIKVDDYGYCFSFSLASTMDGWSVPPINMDLVVETRAKAVAEGVKFSPIHPGTNNCDICGAWFKHGDVWKHAPTGDYITVGHICAAKAEMGATREDWVGARNRAVARARKTAMRREGAAFLKAACKDDLEFRAALIEAREHYIVRNMLDFVFRRGYMTDKMMALIVKLGADEKARKAREAEEALVSWIPVPEIEKRVVLEGVILGTRWDSGPYGDTLKGLFRIDTPEGSFKLWGTVPSGLRPVEKGSKVRFTARVKRSPTDEMFGFFSRPTKASVLAAPAEAA